MTRFAPSIRATRRLAIVLGVGLTIVAVGAVDADAATPTIASFNPTSGPVGASVEISEGEN